MPAAVTNTYGKGRVVYFPQPLGHVYHDYGHVHQQQLIANSVRWAAAEPQPVEIEAPDTVESVLYQHENQYYLHLVNRTACGPIRLKGNAFNRAIPVYRIRVRVRANISSAVSQPAGTSLLIEASKIDGF